MIANGTEFYALIIRWIVNIVLTKVSSFLFPGSAVVNTVKCCPWWKRGIILKVMPPSLGYLCPVTTRFRILKDQSPYPNLGQIWSQFSIRASPKAWLRNSITIQLLSLANSASFSSLSSTGGNSPTVSGMPTSISESVSGECSSNRYQTTDC